MRSSPHRGSAAVTALGELARGFAELVLPRRFAACGAGERDTTGALCAVCSGQLGAPPHVSPASGLALCAVAVRYEGEFEHWIRRYKYPAFGLAGLDPEARTRITALAERAARAAPELRPAVVMPVPLHPQRLRARGFNPATHPARRVARHFGASLDTRSLHRIRNTPSQAGLSRRARMRNVADAFACVRPCPPNVVLVDDVVTTGSTLAACAAALRGAGARQIAAICLAWTPPS